MLELVLERKALLEALENDVLLLEEVIGVFLADSPEKMNILRAAVTLRDSNQIAAVSHSLRGGLSIFGAHVAAEAAQKLEYMGRQREVESVDEAFSLLEHEMALVTSALDQILSETF
jgi:two-component system sensor histidine kinase/response regulator